MSKRQYEAMMEQDMRNNLQKARKALWNNDLYLVCSDLLCDIDGANIDDFIIDNNILDIASDWLDDNYGCWGLEYFFIMNDPKYGESYRINWLSKRKKEEFSTFITDICKSFMPVQEEEDAPCSIQEEDKKPCLSIQEEKHPFQLTDEQVAKLEEAMGYNMPMRMARHYLHNIANKTGNTHAINLANGCEYEQSIEDYASIIAVFLCESIEAWEISYDECTNKVHMKWESDDVRKALYSTLRKAMYTISSKETGSTLYAVDYKEETRINQHGEEEKVLVEYAEWVERKHNSKNGNRFRETHSSYLRDRAQRDALYTEWQIFAEFIASKDMRPVTKAQMQFVLWYKLQGMQESMICGKIGISKARLAQIMAQMRTLYKDCYNTESMYTFKGFMPSATPIYCEWVRHSDVPKARQAQKGASVDRRKELRQHEKAMARYYRLKKPVQAQEWHTMKTGAPMAQAMKRCFDIDTWIYRNNLRDIDFKCARQEEEAIRKALAQ